MNLPSLGPVHLVIHVRQCGGHWRARCAGVTATSTLGPEPAAARAARRQLELLAALTRARFTPPALTPVTPGLWQARSELHAT